MVQQLLIQNGLSEGETKNAMDEFCEEILRLDYWDAVTALQIDIQTDTLWIKNPRRVCFR